MVSHLWQSTIFAAVVGVLAFVLRNNSASARFWLWFAASTKFLVPFAALTALGKRFAWPAASAITPTMARAIDTLGQPFHYQAFDVILLSSAVKTSPLVSLSMFVFIAWMVGCFVVLCRWWLRWWRVAAIARAGSPVIDGRDAAILGALQSRLAMRSPIAMISSTSTLEPGVFGIVRPVMLWPKHLADCLDDCQVEAIIAHELCHVRRRDNLLASIHMLVEAMFWFHPVIWYVGARLVQEREWACDQDVVALGSEPRVYAESILKTCERCLVSPLTNVVGVTGSDLGKRIEEIMTNAKAKSLTTLMKVALVAAAALVMCTPVLIGSVSAQSLQTQTDQSFEVVSVKTNKSGDRGGASRFQPGGYSGTNVTVRRVIDLAYLPLLHDQIVGGPDWIDSARFDIVAKAGRTPSPSQLRLMLRSMLADRFKLAVHNDTREVPVYALVVARPDRKLGPQLRMSQVVCDGATPQSPQASSGQGPPCGFSVGDGALRGQGITIEMFAQELSLVGRVVLDRTGLDGRFDVDLKWTPDDARDTSAAATEGSIFTALQEQLGLKLESTKGSVSVLVIDHAEQPAPD